MATLYAGTSGYAYPAWKPGFYPEDVPATRFLQHYSSRLNCVEINYTFRHMPSEKTLTSWVAATPPGFTFVLKAHQAITHRNRLKEGAREPLEYFLGALAPLRDAGRLGPVLLQLPPNLKLDLERLERLPRPAAAGRALRVRVPRAVVVRRGRVRAAAGAQRLALRRRGREPGGAGRGDRRLRLLPPAQAALRRARRWRGCAAARRSSPAAAATSTSSSSTRRTPAARSRPSGCWPPEGRGPARPCGGPAGGPEVRGGADGTTLGTMTGAPFTPRRARPRRRRGSASWWPLILTAIAIVVVAVAGFALVTRRPDAGGPAAASSSAAPSSAAPSSAALAVRCPRALAVRLAHRGRPRLCRRGRTSWPTRSRCRSSCTTTCSSGPRGRGSWSSAPGCSAPRWPGSSAHGYQAVTLRRVYDAWTGDGVLPPHPVVLTFDDGYADQVRNAAPVLRQYRWPAELDLVSGALYLGDDPPATSLTPEMVQGLLNDGWGLESHSVSHLDLTRALGREAAPPAGRLARPAGGALRRAGRVLLLPGRDLRPPGQAGRAPRRLPAATGTRYAAATPRDLFSLGRIYAYRGESMSSFGARLDEILAAEAD